MKEIRYLLIMAICAIGLAACQDEDLAGIGQGVNTDKPVKVELKFGVPRSPEISVSRADNSVSGIYGIRLYIFDLYYLFFQLLLRVLLRQMILMYYLFAKP